jgi:general secretion pathway protein I
MTMTGPPTVPPPAKERGFTLLEMLVALSVLSIAALALVRLDAFTLRSATDLSRTGAAQVVANNKAVDLLTDPAAPTIGIANESVSNAGSTWRVTSRVAQTADPALLRIDIAVSGNGGRAALTIIRPAG